MKPATPARSGSPVRASAPVTVDAAHARVKLPTQQQIAIRAFEIYERSGRVEGRSLENWLQAERELMARALETAPPDRG